MAKVALETVGCRLNQYETERLAGELSAAGLERVDYTDRADLYILNTCTVTGRADADCRKLIRRAYRRNKNAIIIVSGCYVEAAGEMIGDLEGVDLLIDNHEKIDAAKIIKRKYPYLFDGYAAGVHPQVKKSSELFGDYSRAMVKIADGCDQNCAYCIVPRVRGRFYSIDSRVIIDEIGRSVEAGYHEVVLTAVHIGKYSHNGLNLGRLVEKILKETTLSRLRLSSLEPNELDNRLIELICDHSRVCRHLHLPLQSGSDRILKFMRRPYRRGDYLSVVEKVKTRNSDVTLGCDLIVGFPGEEDADFELSLDILENGGLDYGHLFSYSDRPGTTATKMPDKVMSDIIKERNRRAREVIHSRKIAHYKSQIGKILRVIPERKARRDGYVNAISDNYVKIKISAEGCFSRKIMAVRATQLAEGGEKNICLAGKSVAS